MFKSDFIATLDEYEKFVQNLDKSAHRFADEWLEAFDWGWDSVTFQELYKNYVWSTQIILKKEDDPTKLKGVPLEKLSRYFLEKGGVARNIVEIIEHGRWQVDGQGSLNKSAIRRCWGSPISEDCGFQLYLECKNHSEPVENTEFALHEMRMNNHGCNLGVMISTSGFRVGRGLGIANVPYLNFLQKKFHLLLVFGSFKRVIDERIPPLALLQEVLGYAANNSYVNEKRIQDFYTEHECTSLARNEYARLFG